MSKNNDDFFDVKKDWSKIKDALLDGYLPEYFAKVLWTQKTIVYVDCFSGKGKFNSGEDGSPRMALKSGWETIVKSRSQNKRIDFYFIEARYANELSSNIADLKTNLNVEVLDGKYEEEIDSILSSANGKNIFLYIDPYGVKTLNFSFFTKLAQNKSVEFLLNLNSFGFLRAGFSALNISEFEFLFDDDDLISIEPIYSFEKGEKLASRLDLVAGGNYWREIILKCKNREITTRDAEKEFTRQYINLLKKHFSFVLNMPIKLKPTAQPKYRMIHVLNHEDGCLLMAENISRQKDKLFIDIQGKGQQSLFEETFENEVIDITEIKEKILQFLNSEKNLTTFIAEFYTYYGMLCKVNDLKEALKELEKQGKIIVTRNPALSEKLRKPTVFWDENKGHKVRISKSL